EQCDKRKEHSNPGSCTKARLRTFYGLSKIETRREAFAYRPQLPENSRVHPIVHVFLGTAQPKQLPIGLSEEWEFRTRQQDVFDLGYKC
ncbi:hypothetical protein A2U01_0016897, partial [Trifolium medium]|nr:hypothetical protein [Trifolium medium]